MDPPTTPPFRFYAVSPGLFTSNDRIMIILGGTFRALSGTGKYSHIYCNTHSMLYFSWAEIGIIGAFSAIVPFMNVFISSKFLLAAYSINKNNNYS